ncbi:unnamed protein product [Ascophyllum nodosum]
MEGFQRCLHCAETLIRDCRWSGRSEDVPLDLIEVVGKREITNLYSEDNNRVAVESFCNREIAPVPRMSVLSSDSEVYVFSIHIQKVLHRAFFVSHGGVVQASPDEGCDSGWEVTGPRGADESEARATRTRESTIGENLYLSRLNGVARQLGSVLSSVELLELVAQRLTIGSGLGRLLINSTLAVAKATKGDYGGALRHTRSAVDALSRYPGVIRFSIGFHCPHYLASFLAVLDDPEARGLYGTVRTVFNGMRSPSFSPIPPLEEWKGVHTCCQHIICRTMENLFKRPCLSRSPTSDLIVAIVEKEPVVMGDGKALSEVLPTGTTPAFSCAGDARHRHAPERELVVLAGADNTYDGDGENGCGQGRDPIGSESPATWADTCPTGPKYVKQPRQDSAGTATPAAACSGVVCEMIAAPPCAREADRTTPLFGTYGSSSIGASKSVNGSRAADISSMQSFDGEDPAMTIMSHQNGCHDGSSSGSDITSEDWLHVAETVLPHVGY